MVEASEGLGFVAEAGAGFERGCVVVGAEEFDDDLCAGVCGGFGKVSEPEAAGAEGL